MARILIAEDESDIRELITLTLEMDGYEVFGCENGEEAIRIAKEKIPDLILLDVRMPRKTGYEACAAIKADEALKDIPVVFLSAKGQEGEVRTGLAAGALDYILKPFAPDKLLHKVRELLTDKGVEVSDKPIVDPAKAVEEAEKHDKPWNHIRHFFRSRDKMKR